MILAFVLLEAYVVLKFWIVQFIWKAVSFWLTHWVRLQFHILAIFFSWHCIKQRVTYCFPSSWTEWKLVPTSCPPLNHIECHWSRQMCSENWLKPIFPFLKMSGDDGGYSEVVLGSGLVPVSALAGAQGAAISPGSLWNVSGCSHHDNNWIPAGMRIGMRVALLPPFWSWPSSPKFPSQGKHTVCEVFGSRRYGKSGEPVEWLLSSCTPSSSQHQVWRVRGRGAEGSAAGGRGESGLVGWQNSWVPGFLRLHLCANLLGEFLPRAGCEQYLPCLQGVSCQDPCQRSSDWRLRLGGCPSSNTNGHRMFRVNIMGKLWLRSWSNMFLFGPISDETSAC